MLRDDTRAPTIPPGAGASRALLDLPALNDTGLLGAEAPLGLLFLENIELVAAPFASFREVGEFHQLLQTLPGVKRVQLRRLQHGALHVRVECPGGRALLESLGQVGNQRFQVLTQEPYRLEILLTPREPALEMTEERRGA